MIQLLRQTAPGDTLFLCYEGHGYRESKSDGFFAAYDTDNDAVPGWSINSICPTINRYFWGNRAFLTADCCDSGYLAQVAAKQTGRVSYACLTSLSAREVSTGNWTFTDCLLDALHGQPYVDLDGIGTITLAELASFTRSEMAIAEEQHAVLVTSGTLSPEVPLAVARPQPRAPLGQRVKVKYGAEWLAGRIVAVRPGEMQVKCIGYDDPADWFDTGDSTQLRRLRPKRRFPIGARVEVKWKGDWYEARRPGQRFRGECVWRFAGPGCSR